MYAQPSKELSNLADQGAVLRLAHGYYAVVPEPARGGAWRPPIEAVGLGIAQVDYGTDGAALMGPSAARVLGFSPRASAVATVAVTKQRPAMETVVGLVQFVTRSIERLQLQRVRTELAVGWTTTVEQTLLDIADRPELGGLTHEAAVELLTSLSAEADLDLACDLGREQRKRTARERIARSVATGTWSWLAVES